MIRLWFAFGIMVGLGTLIWQGAERMYNQGVTDAYQRCKQDSIAVIYWRINEHYLKFPHKHNQREWGFKK